MYRDAGPPRPTQVCGVYTVLAMVRRPKDLWETRPVGAAVRIRKNTSTDGPLLPPLLTRQRRRSPEGASEGSEFRVNSSKTTANQLSWPYLVEPTSPPAHPLRRPATC